MTSRAEDSDPSPDLSRQRVAAFLRDFSLEATYPTANEIAALKNIVAVGTQVYLTAVPGQPPARAIAAATELRAAGFEPVPHLAVRTFPDAAALDEFLGRAAGAGVRRLLVIAGDCDQPAGPFACALDAIEMGMLPRHGIEAIGVAGYPDGHPRIARAMLAEALAAKVSRATRAGLRVHIVTQFGFDAERIVAWAREIRAAGIAVPLKIGIAGPVSLAKLVRYAQRCGVAASVRSLARQAKSVGGLLGQSTPDDLVQALADALAAEPFGEATPHFYSFGGIVATARYASAVAAAQSVAG